MSSYLTVNKVRDENTSITKQVTLFSSRSTGVHSHGRGERVKVEPVGRKLITIKRMVFTLPVFNQTCRLQFMNTYNAH